MIDKSFVQDSLLKIKIFYISAVFEFKFSSIVRASEGICWTFWIGVNINRWIEYPHKLVPSCKNLVVNNPCQHQKRFTIHTYYRTFCRKILSPNYRILGE